MEKLSQETDVLSIYDLEKNVSHIGHIIQVPVPMQPHGFPDFSGLSMLDKS